MKKIFLTLLLAVFCATLWVACKKNELDPSFKGQSSLLLTGVADEGARADSIGFTFAIWPATLQDTQVTIIAQVLGNIANEDRPFEIEVDPASTALPSEYELPQNLVIPAGGFRTSFPVTIKRSDRIQNATAKLILRVKPNEYFQPGPTFSGTVNSGPSFNVVWTEELTKPGVWDNSMLYSVGQWSKVKHQAIIDVTGIRKYDNLTYSETYAIASIMLDWLNEYNAAHPGNPLRDEKGELVGICSQCN